MKSALRICTLARLAGLFMLIATNVSAEEIFPKDCKAFVVQGEQVQLPPLKNAVVMLHNLSNHDLWITHPSGEAGGANAGWSSQLQAGNWSALAHSGKDFALNCIESMPGHEQQISCATVLAVCQWPNTQMPANTSGTFWAGENMSLSELMAYIERRGFVILSSSENHKES